MENKGLEYDLTQLDRVKKCIKKGAFLGLDHLSQIEYNKRKNTEQDLKIKALEGFYPEGDLFVKKSEYDDTVQSIEDEITNIQGEIDGLDSEIENIHEDLKTLLKAKIVAELPAEDQEENVLYMVPKLDSETNDLFDEYLWVDDSWELVGTKQLDIEMFDDLEGDLPSIELGAINTKRRIMCKNIASGTVSGSGELYLVNCTGEITISGNTAKIYTNNCPELIINGVTQDNWHNVFRDGRASYTLNININKAFDTLVAGSYVYSSTLVYELLAKASRCVLFTQVNSQGYTSWVKNYVLDKMHMEFSDTNHRKNGAIPVLDDMWYISNEINSNGIKVNLAPYPRVSTYLIYIHKIEYEKFLNQ